MSRIEQNSQNPKLNLEKLRKLVDDITESALAEGKEILYVSEILKALKKYGFNLDEMMYKLTDGDRQNVENEIRSLALSCANQALESLNKADSVYNEELTLKKDFLEMLKLFAKYGRIADIHNLFSNLKFFFNLTNVNYMNTLCEIYFTNFLSEEEMVKAKVSDLLCETQIEEETLEEDFEEESPVNSFLKVIEETIKHSSEDVNLELIKENLKANGLNPENYTKEELICFLNDTACMIIDRMIYDDEKLSDLYNSTNLETISENCFFRSFNSNNINCKLIYFVTLYMLCSIGYLNKTLDTYLFARSKINPNKTEKLLLSFLEDELSRR